MTYDYVYSMKYVGVDSSQRYSYIIMARYLDTRADLLGLDVAEHQDKMSTTQRSLRVYVKVCTIISGAKIKIPWINLANGIVFVKFYAISRS